MVEVCRVLDEVGRGTSTFDGLSIAWSVAEHIHDAPRLGAKTLFATHYHHLNELADSLPTPPGWRKRSQFGDADGGSTVQTYRSLL